MQLRRRDVPWEVIDSKNVSPIPTRLENLDLERVMPGELKRKFVLDMKPDELNIRRLERAVEFAQGQLLREFDDCNVLLSESWGITLLKREEQYRIELEYSGRPARATNAVNRQPPYMEILHHLNQVHDATAISTTNVDTTTALRKRITLHRYILMWRLLRT